MLLSFFRARRLGFGAGLHRRHPFLQLSQLPAQSVHFQFRGLLATGGLRRIGRPVGGGVAAHPHHHAHHEPHHDPHPEHHERHHEEDPPGEGAVAGACVQEHTYSSDASAGWGPSSWPKLTRGKARSRERGSHQLARPISRIAADTSTRRIRVAAQAMAIAMPVPVSFGGSVPARAKDPNTATMAMAALLIGRAVRSSAQATLPSLSPVSSYRSLTALSKNIS